VPQRKARHLTSNDEGKDNTMIASDGKLAGLFFIIKRDGDPQAHQIVGQFADGLICRPLAADGTSIGPCVIIDEIELFNAIKNGVASFFADDRSALKTLKEMIGAAAAGTF
jgi:hypothetical protein